MNSETSSKDGRNKNLRMSPEEYAKKLWDWTPLNECFKRGIRFTDVDGFVEVNYHFLHLEGKSKNISLPKGQRMALERLARLPEFTVIVFKGDPPNLNTITEWEVLGKKIYKGKFREFFNFIHRWFEWAEKDNIRNKRKGINNEKKSI